MHAAPRTKGIKEKKGNATEKKRKTSLVCERNLDETSETETEFSQGNIVELPAAHRPPTVTTVCVVSGVSSTNSLQKVLK